MVVSHLGKLKERINKMFYFNNRFSTKLVSIILIFTLLVPLSSVFAQEVKKDYYYDGEAAAQIEYQTSAPVVGGVIAGLLLGLIGWGIGYLIISNNDVEVPRHHTTNLDTTQRMQFEKGYKDYIQKSRASKFNMGGGVGVLTFLVLYLSSN